MAELNLCRTTSITVLLFQIVLNLFICHSFATSNTRSFLIAPKSWSNPYKILCCFFHSLYLLKEIFLGTSVLFYEPHQMLVFNTISLLKLSLFTAFPGFLWTSAISLLSFETIWIILKLSTVEDLNVTTNNGYLFITQKAFLYTIAHFSSMFCIRKQDKMYFVNSCVLVREPSCQCWFLMIAWTSPRRGFLEGFFRSGLLLPPTQG